MRTLWIDRRDASLGWLRGALEIRLPGEAPRRVPVAGLERVVVRGTATLSTAALGGLWQAGAALLVLGGRRSEATARFHGAPHNDAAIRLGQYRAALDAERRRAWARGLVMLRLRVMRRVGRDLARRRRRGAQSLAPARAAIDEAAARLAGGPPPALETLRGIEGAVAAAWFRAYARLLPPSLGFAGRRRRPPPDPVNAALSLGYTLATAEAARAATVAGLDVAVGLLHGLAHGREALALDLVEPARPLVDRFVHDLFHERRLTARSFAKTGEGAVLLGKAGRSTFYTAWEEQAAPAMRRLLRAVCREGVRRIRALGPPLPEAAGADPDRDAGARGHAADDDDAIPS